MKKRPSEKTEKAKCEALMSVHHSNPPRYYWRNKAGNFVNMDFINPHGIKKILRRLDEEGPKSYLAVVEEIARKRGIIDEAGRFTDQVTPSAAAASPEANIPR